MDAKELVEMDARLDRGSGWLHAEFLWLEAEYIADRHETPEWKERAAGWVKQQCRWDVLFAEYVKARDAVAGTETSSAQAETERLWAALTAQPEQSGEPESKTCPRCNEPMTFRSGMTRDGRPYSAWCCEKKCGQRAIWVNAKGKSAALV